jgi:diadenylate cyclase
MIDILSQIGWRDVLDITIVSVILYRLLVILKGTKAAQMILGLILLLVASIISRYVELYTLSWLLQGFWAYIVIALIVLFQPEIRRGLAKMGAAPFFQNFASAAEVKGLEEIVRATVMLAERKIGALIVIERDMNLRELEEYGSPLDSKVTKEIILSIFHPTSPIHDGAIIIRGNRIVAAGCFLPLSITSSISRTLGTRHRAALGLSEETDAVVVIVSEETGGISLSMDGKLETHFDMGSLRNMFTEIFTGKGIKK